VKPYPPLAEVGMEGTTSHIYVAPRTFHNHFETVTRDSRPGDGQDQEKKKKEKGRESTRRIFGGDGDTLRTAKIDKSDRKNGRS
jgi:hypothetical protein